MTQNDHGAASVEFAVVGPVFLLVLFVAFNLSLCLLEQNILKYALGTASRAVRLGTIRSVGDLRSAVCQNASVILDCTTNLSVMATAGSSFASQSSSAFGTSNDFVLITAQYQATWAAGFMNYINGNNSQTLILSEAFQNEPF